MATNRRKRLTEDRELQDTTRRLLRASHAQVTASKVMIDKGMRAVDRSRNRLQASELKKELRRHRLA
jgi:hypothetical protein